MSDGSAADRSLRALADPTRAAILRRLLAAADGRATVGALAAELELQQPTVSHHMKLLRGLGLVDGEAEGRRVWYSVSAGERERVAEILDAHPVARMTGHVLQRIIADLSMRFAGTFSPGTIERYVLESYDLLADGATITRYLPSLTARFAADRLSALAAIERPDDQDGVPEVLFVCVQNAGRSQLAAAILRHLAGDRVHVRTAGSAPADAVRTSVVAALDEIGVPLGGEFPKPLTDEIVRAADVVVTMGCGDACPIYPGRRYLDWPVDDPVGLPIDQVRRIRDDIDARVRELLGSLS